MKAIRLEEPGRFALLSVEGPPLPDSIQPGDALVRVARIGVCGTDIHAFIETNPFSISPESSVTNLASRLLRWAVP
jgi:threonine dehydrogenase-like Zn-dependent dehydrogenase